MRSVPEMLRYAMKLLLTSVFCDGCFEDGFRAIGTPNRRRRMRQGRHPVQLQVQHTGSPSVDSHDQGRTSAVLTLYSSRGRGMAADGSVSAGGGGGELDWDSSANEYGADDNAELDGVGLGCLILTIDQVRELE